MIKVTQGWMNPFRLRQRVADNSKPPLVIVPITLADPAIVEIMGFAGAEAVLLDSEHGMMGPETLRSMLAHAMAANVPAVFRPRNFDAAACSQALEQGAAGVHVPHVDSGNQARAVVNACRYSPLGRREMSLGRAVQYQGANIASYVAEANDCLLLVIMIESVRGLASLKDTGVPWAIRLRIPRRSRTGRREECAFLRPTRPTTCSVRFM